MAESTDEKTLSDKELVFTEHYLICLNKTTAAIASGAPETGARQQGYEIYNRPHVKAYIAAKLKECTLEADEVIKLVSDTAQATLTDYYKPVMVPFTPKIKAPLADLIAERNQYIAREMEFLNRVGYTEEQYDEFVANLQVIKNSIIRMEIELESNPDAYRVIDGVEEMREEMQLDMAMLVADKEKGRVKKIKVLKDGTLEIELYSALDAQEKLMRMHGKYEKDNEQAKPTVIISGMEIK
jgi:phage terminase small subunit